VTAALPHEAEEFLSWLAVERGRASATLRAYRRDLLLWASYLDTRGRTLLTAVDTDVEAFLASLQADRSRATVARVASTLRGLYGFLLDEGVLTRDPTALLAARRAGERLPKALTEEQVDALLASPATDGAVDVRDRAVLELLYGTGIRVSELVGLDLGDIDFTEELMRVTGKGSKQRLVPIGRTAGAAVRQWIDGGSRDALRAASRIASRKGSGTDTRAVFCNQRGGRLTRQGVDLVVRRHARRAGLPSDTSAHTLRHSCATHMLAHGADVRVIQELLGHASVATTQRYTKVTQTHLVEAYRTAHPRAGDVPVRT
jgi:site-specific recombinase XerD